MLKLVKYLLIARITKDPLLAARIYQMIYLPEIKQNWPHDISVPKPETSKVSYQGTTSLSDISHKGRDENMTKRREAEQALSLLKNKQNKTLADKTSIGMLEAIIPNLK